ncbi:HAD family hydrolase [Sporomusa sp. KB1]|jgi:soluble P-type ATPase|uniref:HAD family hydrolase n=1 Tax=Sporomusa sp. KB1 TaxID=943346 RepID=UPI0011AB227D|nr:HAD family hydrolase [Sporomusa sp. KB1]TWH45489.1 soluble P-type ATPase [Sporomusa sp. KB1]
MINFTLPDGREYKITNAVFDYNGTLAEDGVMAGEIKELLEKVSEVTRVTVLTADTFGLARTQLENVAGVQLHIINKGEEVAQKRDFVRACGADTTICFGNGANDRAMFAEALLAVGVIGPEGAYQPTLAQADIVVTNPKDALLLLLKPGRLVATLRT